ncbi:Membrane protein [uncultured Gammaproteobacteria bacterium]
MRWTWDLDKDAINRRKHGLPLSVGEVALVDPLALSRQAPHPDGDRWGTLCQAGSVLLYIIHSVRKATRQERKAYEDGEH